MTTQATWFNAFFEAMSSTPEYKEIMSGMTDISNMEKQLREMDKKTAKLWELNTALQETFDTPEVRKAWKNTKAPLSSRGEGLGVRADNKKTGNAKDEEKITPLEIKYFKNTEPATWGFKWVAWMADLKEELKESFIQPLQFKFFVQKLEEQKEAPLSSKDSPLQRGTKGGDKERNSTNNLYKQLYKTYKQFKVWIPTGMLFYGPPWTGKTYITKKLAQELNAWFIKKSVWEFGSSYVHQTSKNIHNFFKQAKEASEKWPIILFLDEIDSLVSKRWGNVDASKAEEVSQFLQEFNNLDDAPNLIIVAATNRPDHLDSAILRSGRFDKKIYIWEPDFVARKELFEIFIEKKQRPHTKLDYRELAMLSEWYVAADIEAIVDEAARDASQWILDLVKLVQDWKHDMTKIQKELESHTISMELLKQAIIDTTPSIKMVDMSIYTDWLKKIEN